MSKKERANEIYNEIFESTGNSEYAYYIANQFFGD